MLTTTAANNEHVHLHDAWQSLWPHAKSCGMQSCDYVPMLALSPFAAAATTDWPRCAEPLRRAHGKQVGWPLSIIVAAQARWRASSDRAAPGKGLKAPHVSQPRPPWHTPQCTPFPKQQSLASRAMAFNQTVRLLAALPLALHRPSANFKLPQHKLLRSQPSFTRLSCV